MKRKNTGILILAVVTAISVACGRSAAKKNNTVPSAADITSGSAAETNDSTAAEKIQQDTDAPTEAPTEPFSEDISLPDGYTAQGSCVIDGFHAVLQNPELPTGCEVTALTETLNFLGFDIDKETLFDNYMPVDYAGTYTMNYAYIGDPRATDGFGCYAPVVVKTADDYFRDIDSPCYAQNLTDTSLRDLFYQIDCGRPVVVWVTMDMRVSYPKYVFTATNGEDMEFNYYQHCLTIYGYDIDNGLVYAADPLKDNVTYPISDFETVYDTMGRQAVVICGNAETEGTFNEDYSYEEFDCPLPNAQQKKDE